MVSSIEDFNKFIVSHAKQITDAIISANKEQNDALNTQARAKAKKRTISSLMNDFVSHNLEENLAGKSGIQIKHHYNQLHIIFSPDFIMKCKKSERGRISFSNTQLMFNFMHQLPSMLPGMPDLATNIVLIYEWNIARTEIQKIAIQCPNGKNSYLWEVPIPLTTAPELLPQTQTQEIISLPTEIKRIMPKSKRIKKSKKGLVNKNEQRKEFKS